MNKEDLLYHYFSNSLTEEQELRLKELLKTDTEFKKQFELENNLKPIAKHKHLEELKTKLQGFETEITQHKTIKKPMRFNWKIAASVILLLGAGWFGYQSAFNINYNTLYNDNYTVYPNTSYTIVRNGTDDSKERQAFVAYETEDYLLALNKFEALEAKEYLDFYKAQCYLKLSQLNQAKLYFKVAIKNNKEFVAEAHWYLALIHLKQKEKTEAINNLETLITNYNYKTEEAKTLLNKLE